MKLNSHFFLVLGFVFGLQSAQAQQPMQGLTPEQMQRLEDARNKKKIQASKKKTVPAKKTQAAPLQVQKPQQKPLPVMNSTQPAVSKKPVSGVSQTGAKPAKKPQAPPPVPEPVIPSNDSLESELGPAASSPATQTLSRKNLVTKKRPGAFFYVSTGYLSFADQIFAKVSGQKQRARSVFTGYLLGADYTRYTGRYVYSWNLNFVSGFVDIARVFGATYPRKSFWGAQSGPEIGYRVNSDFDLSWGLNLLFRDIENVGPSFALSNQLNLKFRYSPRLTFFQTIGNYGKPTSYSYSLGLRWLL